MLAFLLSTLAPVLGGRLRRVAGGCLLTLIASLAPGAASAGAANYTLRYSASINGSITMAANTLETCPPAANGCTAALSAATNQNAADNTLNNNAYTMQYVNVDPTGHFNSSSSQLGLPSGATVLWAGLYWAGSTSAGTNGAAAPNIASRGTVLLKAPGASSYQTITAAAGDIDSLNYGGHDAYQGFSDVTSLVQTAGTGSYTIANVQSGTGQDRYAAWTLVVAYRDPAATTRNLSVFDGLTNVGSGNSQSVTVSGFRTPATGSVNTQVGVVNYESDLGITGDTATLVSGGVTTRLQDALTKVDNFANSAIESGGVRTTTKSPDYSNNLGIDSKILKPGAGSIPNGANSATINFDSTGDVYFPGIVTIATDLYSPTLSGTVFVDDDANGTKAPGENGRDAVTVGLYAADGTTLLATTRTDATGGYTFSATNYPAFEPGTYVVKAFPPGGFLCSGTCQTTVTLGSGQAVSRDLGIYQNASVAGTVYTDANGNATKDGSEIGFPNVTVYNDANSNGSLDPGEASTVSDQFGGYTLSGLTPGNVRIRTVAPSGYLVSEPAGSAYALNLTSGQAAGGKNFGLYQTPSASGTVYTDSNGDGSRQNGEPAISGRSVWVDYDGDGVRDPGEPTATTAADGSYTISGFPPGTWTVRVDRTGAESCRPAGCQRSVAFTSGGSVAGLDFGVSTPGVVSGTVYTDSNASGSRQNGEAGLSGQLVYLDTNGNGAFDAGEPSNTTSATGTYSLTNLPPGTSGTLRVRLPGGYTVSEPPAGSYPITVTSGVALTRDFGAFQNATLSGHLYEDTNGNHAHESAEPALANQTVRLYAADGTTVATTTTDANGLYTFAGVTPGSYALAPVLTGGYVCSSPNPCRDAVAVTSGQTSGSHDFTAFQNATVSGNAWTDSNNNAAHDSGEPAKPGVVVYADLDNDGTRDPGEPTATTDPSGNYTLAGVAPGSVHVRAELAAGYACSTPADCDHALTLTSGQAATGKDFGLVQSATAAGRLARDDNGDGTADAGEPPLVGWTVYVDSDGNGQFDVGEPSAVTGPDGRYTIPGVNPGIRTVRVARPASWTCSSPCSRSIAFTSGATTSGIDFALYEPVTIAGTVFEDENGNGSKDTGDGGLGNRDVFLDTNDDGTQDPGEATTTTANDGSYSFGNLAPGTYHVRTSAAVGFTCTSCAATRALTSGQSATVNLGMYQAATASGTVYEDSNGDGTQDPGEQGLSGRTVFFDLNNDGNLDSGEPTTATDGQGRWSLTGLAPAAGTLRAVLPAGYVRTEPATSGYAETLTSSDTLTGRDFGGYAPGSIAGHVTDDLDGNGTTDSGEPGKANWTVYLDTNDDGTHDAGEPTATTDSNGDYAFTRLAPDTYHVRPVVTSGTTCTGPTPCVYTHTLTSGDAAAAPDFALAEAATASGVVYRDTDADGTHGSREPGLSGQTVWVDLNSDGNRDPGEPFATTDNTGAYTIDGVLPGTYPVRYDAPAGEHVSEPAGGAYLATFTSGFSVTGRDFGTYRDASVSGNVYDDADRSGSRGSSEIGLSGRTVSLDRDADGTVDQTTQTDTNGDYSFTGLVPGDFRVTVTIPGGDLCTAPTPCRVDRTLGSGATSAGADFGLAPLPAADLRLRKSAPATVTQGETFDYTLSATNDGPDDAISAAISDRLPAGVAFVSAGAGCTESGGTVTCAIGTLANGASITRTITVRAVDNGDIGNTATVASATNDPTPGNDSDSARVTVAPAADVELGKTGPATVAAGATATYTITAVNHGPADATGVKLRDTLPPGLTFDAAASDAGWTLVAPNTYELTVGTLADGANVAKQLVARAEHRAADTTQVNHAAVSSDTRDPDSTNDDAIVSTDVGPSADLSLTKTASAGPISQGQSFTYTLTAHNGGPSAATGVSVSDALPSGVTFVSAASGCTNAGGTLTCAIGALADGASSTRTITVRADAAGPIDNTASIAGGEPDGDRANDSATARITVQPAANIGVTKTGPAAIAADGQGTYTIALRDQGPADATNPRFTDALPAGITFVSVTSPTGWSCQTPAVGAGGTVSCSAATLAAGSAPASFSLTVRAASSLTGQSVRNTVQASADEADGDPSDNSSFTDAVVGPAADVAITKTGPAAAPADQAAEYTLHVTNRGPAAATAVQVSDPLPAGLNFVAASTSQGSCSSQGRAVTCDVGRLDANGEATVTVRALTGFRQAGQTVVNTASVRAAEGDPNPANNVARQPTTIGPASDLTMTKSAPERVPAGGLLVYTLDVANAGPQDAGSVHVSDRLPAGLRFVSAEPSQGTCAAAGQVVTCDLGSVTTGGGAQVLVSADVGSGLAGRDVRNFASASADTPDPNLRDNRDDAVTRVTPAAAVGGSLSVTKVADHATARLGSRLGYTITVRNGTDRTASGVVAIDRPSFAADIVSVTPSRGRCDGLSCRLGSMRAGTAARIRVVMIPKELGTLANSVTVSSNEGDGDVGDNRDVVKVHVAGRTTFSLVEHAAKRQVDAGDAVWFVIRARNTGRTGGSHVRVCVPPLRYAAFESARGARFDHGSACWTVAYWAPGSVRVFRVKLRVARSAHGRITNPVTLTARNAARRTARAGVGITARGGTRAGGVTG